MFLEDCLDGWKQEEDVLGLVAIRNAEIARKSPLPSNNPRCLPNPNER